MKSKLISASVFAVAGLLSVGSFAQTGGGYSSSTYGQSTSTSTLTRDQVKAELAQARRDGTLSNFANNDAAYPPAPVATAGSGKTRAEVKAELAQAVRDGTLTNFDNNDADYPPAPVANAGSGKTRAEVKAELSAAGPRAPQYEVDHSYPAVQ
jgi:hypothetical protein